MADTPCENKEEVAFSDMGKQANCDVKSVAPISMRVPRRGGRVTRWLMIVLDVAYLASLGAYSAAFEAEQSSGLSFQVPA
jgi:hypothetical protein